ALEAGAAELLLALLREGGPSGPQRAELLNRTRERSALAALDRPVFAVRPPDVRQERGEGGAREHRRAAPDRLAFRLRPDPASGADGRPRERHDERRGR